MGVWSQFRDLATQCTHSCFATILLLSASSPSLLVSQDTAHLLRQAMDGLASYTTKTILTVHNMLVGRESE